MHPSHAARCFGVFVAIAVLFRDATASVEGDNKFLVISSPLWKHIQYLVVPAEGVITDSTPKMLIENGLQSPQGIAVDQYRRRLLVADATAQQVLSYTLIASDDGRSLTASEPMTIASGVEAHWVAVDGRGNIFFSVEPNNQIVKVPVSGGGTTPDVVYDSTLTYNAGASVSFPGGLAVDNFNLFWTNKQQGSTYGTLLKGLEIPQSPAGKAVSILAKNADTAYGVCLAMDNVFFTGHDKNVFGLKKGKTPVTQITSELGSPRGCVWDGDGSVYVADRTKNAIYSFAGGSMQTLQEAPMNKVVDFKDPFGLAFFSVPSGALALVGSRWCLLRTLGLMFLVLRAF